MRNRQPDRGTLAGRDRVATALAWSVLSALAVATVAVLVFVAVVKDARGPLIGTWIGRDSTGAVVLYHFATDGSGFRVTGGQREELRHMLIRGHPNEIDVRFVSNDDTALCQGLVEFVANGHIRLELGHRGAPAPRRLSTHALNLDRPPTR